MPGLLLELFLGLTLIWLAGFSENLASSSHEDNPCIFDSAGPVRPCAE